MKHASETVQKLNERYYWHKTRFKHPNNHEFYFSYQFLSIAIQRFHESNCKGTFYKDKIEEKHPVIVPQWPSIFAPRIKTKFKDFRYKKVKFTRVSWFYIEELSKNYV